MPVRPASRRYSWAPATLALYVVLGTAYTVLRALDVGGPAVLLKALLMPTLLLWVVLSLGRRTPRLVVAALALATVGDVGLEFEAGFLIGMAGFLGMQVCYVVGFLRLGAWTRVRDRWWVGAAYLVVWLGANLVLGPRLDDLRIPILVYSLALTVMATVAAGVDRRVGLGGLLFLVSDLLIGFDLAELDFAGRGSVVMVTYL
ncbi:MAG TPA: lysoplasmalogenase, partial [Jiangellales bacterium]|nr:lysoplasmalogenase [Jiangellales bacterium]